MQQELDSEKSRNDKALLAKDKQIDDLNARLKESHQLQVGLQKRFSMLPDVNNSPVVEADAQEVTKQGSNNEEVKDQKIKKRGFWGKIFGA